MRLDVYNTYARRTNGDLMHFDVLMPTGSEPHQAKEKAMQWLKSIGVVVEHAVLESCDFCHVEDATPEYVSQVKRQGYAILQLEGCPSPIY